MANPEEGQTRSTAVAQALAVQLNTISRASRAIEEWTETRDTLIRMAVEQLGGTYREVGKAADLSHTAVQFIVKGRPPTS